MKEEVFVFSAGDDLVFLSYARYLTLQVYVLIFSREASGKAILVRGSLPCRTCSTFPGKSSGTEFSRSHDFTDWHIKTHAEGAIGTLVLGENTAEKIPVILNEVSRDVLEMSIAKTSIALKKDTVCLRQKRNRILVEGVYRMPI